MEFGPIRPPSEATSLLLRLTRNCTWNRCRFCHTYKGQRFSLRTVKEIKEDICQASELAGQIDRISKDFGCGGKITPEVMHQIARRLGQDALHIAFWLHFGGETVFLQDANSLAMQSAHMVEVLCFLHDTFPQINRVTAYARSKTLARKTVEELTSLRQAGLTRVHVGMESGYDPLLAYVEKGATAADHIEGGRKTRAAGLSLSEYVILGLGGTEMTREHALATAEALSAINPHFIRFRSLAITPAMPLYEDVASGKFVSLPEDEVVKEERLLIENLQGVDSYIASDHSLNLLMEVEGRLPGARRYLLDVIDRYLNLAPSQRLNFRLGRRLRAYQRLDDMENRSLHKRVDDILAELGDPKAVEAVIRELHLRCI